MIIWSDLSPQFFCTDATLLCKFETDTIGINHSTSLDRIVADKSHRVIVA